MQHWGGERAEFLGGDDVGSFEEALQRADFEKPFPEVVRDGGGTECRVPLETFPEKRMRAFSLGDGDPAGTQEPQRTQRRTPYREARDEERREKTFGMRRAFMAIPRFFGEPFPEIGKNAFARQGNLFRVGSFEGGCRFIFSIVSVLQNAREAQ